VLVVLVVSGVVGFNALKDQFFPERSTEAFCEVYNQDQQEYTAKYGGQPEDGFDAFGNAVGAMSAWVPMFDRWADHAPDEIRSDVEHIRDSVKSQIDQAGGSADNPLGSLAEMFVTGMMARDSFERLGAFVEANCVTDEMRAAQAEAAAQAELESDIVTATNLLVMANDDLQSQLDSFAAAGPDFSTTFSNLDVKMFNAESGLENVRHYTEGAKAAGVCDEPYLPWEDDLTLVTGEAEYAPTVAADISQFGPKPLREAADKAEALAVELTLLKPDAAEPRETDRLRAEADGVVQELDAALAEAQQQADDIVAELQAMAAEAQALVDAAC
jgi:hypothetical protein